MAKTKKRKPIDYSQRLEGLKKVYNVKSDRELAEKLKVSTAIVYNIRSGRTKTVNKKLKTKINSRFSYYKFSDALYMFRYTMEVSYTELSGKRVRRWVSSDYARTIREAGVRSDDYLLRLRTDPRFYGKLRNVRVLKMNLEKRLKLA